MKNTFNQFLVRCPKTRRIVGINFRSKLSKILFPVIGLLAIIWFLIRVIPKPNRIIYPCQQVSLGIGSSLIIWLTGVVASYAVFQKIKKHRIILAFFSLVALVSFGIIERNEG